jgi:pimeloyl-ACP methyl ester carboxylesterase
MLTIGTQRLAVYESSGEGPPVLLVHGNSSSAQIWRQTLDGDLGRKYRIVALDLPGHGASADASSADRALAYSIPGYGAVINGVVEQLSLQRAVCVGWSLGGHAVLEASVALPQAAGFMVFGAPPLPYPPAPDFAGAFLAVGLGFEQDWTVEQARQYVESLLAPGAAVPEFMVQDALRTDGHARSSVAASIGTVGFADEVLIVGALPRPLAMLQGGSEQIVNLAYLQGLAGAIPKLWFEQVHVVPNAGHALQWEQPARFDALLDAFVASCQLV